MADRTAQKIFEDELPPKLEGNDSVQDINAVYEFDVSGDNGGTWTLDFTKDGNYITEGSTGDADCVVKISDSDFVDMYNGDLPGPQAFMMGKINVEGDMGLAMKLQKFIG